MIRGFVNIHSSLTPPNLKESEELREMAKKVPHVTLNAQEREEYAIESQRPIISERVWHESGLSDILYLDAGKFSGYMVFDGNKIRLAEKTLPRGLPTRLLLGPLVGWDSMLVMDPTKRHAQMRQYAHDQLHPTAVETFMEVIFRECESALAQWAQQGRVMGVASTTKLVKNIIFNTIFANTRMSDEDQDTFILVMDLFSPQMLERAATPKPLREKKLPGEAEFVRIRDKTHGIIRKEVQWRIQHPGGTDLFDLLVREMTAAGESENAIVHNVFTMFLASYETTLHMLAWLLYTLGSNPEVAALAREEAQRLMPAGSPITFAQLSQMKTIKQLIDELMRLYSPSWQGFLFNQWFTRLGDYSLSPLKVVYTMKHLVHMDPRLWDKPEEFRMDRAYSADTFMPFGSHMHFCVGAPLALAIMRTAAGVIARDYAIGVDGLWSRVFSTSLQAPQDKWVTVAAMSNN